MEDKRGYLRLIDSSHIENRIYFMNHTFNGMFYLDVEDFSVHFVHRFSNGQDDALSMSSVNLACGDIIYFFPAKANAIMGYDFTRQQERIIPIQYFQGENCMLGGIIRLGDIVYMFPSDLGKGIYRFDLQTERIDKEVELSRLFESGFACGNIFIRDDNCALLSMAGGNKLAEVNLQTKEIVYSKEFGEDMRNFSVCFDGKHYWILPEGSTDIYEWDIEKDTVRIYTNENAVWGERQDVAYSNLVFLENEILVLNCHMQNILRINKEKKTIGEPVPFPEGFEIVKNKFPGRPVCEHYVVLGDKILLFPGNGNMLLVYDIVTRQMSGKDFSVSPEEDSVLQKALKESFMREDSFKERDSLWGRLEDYLYIVKADKGSDSISFSGEQSGKLIYQNCQNQV